MVAKGRRSLDFFFKLELAGHLGLLVSQIIRSTVLELTSQGDRLYQNDIWDVVVDFCYVL